MPLGALAAPSPSSPIELVRCCGGCSARKSDCARPRDATREEGAPAVGHPPRTEPRGAADGGAVEADAVPSEAVFYSHEAAFKGTDARYKTGDPSTHHQSHVQCPCLQRMGG